MARSARALSSARALALLFAVGGLLPTPAHGDPEAASLRVVPETVEVGGFFHGAVVEVVGELPVGYRPAVLLAGGERPLELQKKGKVRGLLWMTVGSVEFPHVPELYLLATSSGLDDLAPAAERHRLGLGLDVLAAALHPVSPENGSALLAQELVKLRVDEELYNTTAGAIRVTPQTGGPGLLSVQFALPARVREGAYEVRLWGFREGTGTLLATSTLDVRRVGVTRLVGTLARQHGTFYGILSVLAALGAGLLTGALFGRGASKGH